MSRTDRISGTLLGLAAGDALGAGYEFQADPLGPDGDAEMIGGGLGGFEPGEWTDDTAMAVCIAEIAAEGDEVDLDAIGDRFLDWYRHGPKDIGISTVGVLSQAGRGADLRGIADDYFEAHPKGAAGNGSLMRTAPVALATLDAALADTAQLAREVSHLTHGDPLAADACVLWCAAIRVAIHEGRFDGIEQGLAFVDEARRDDWAGWIDEARTASPATFAPNGFVVPALQAAYAAVVQTPVPDDGPACLHLQRALHNAVRIGHDTDTVAAIAGSLLGARWGGSAIPFRWRRRLHGWPGYQAGDLMRLAVLAASGGRGDGMGWPDVDRMPPQAGRKAAAIPGDEWLVLGSLADLDHLDRIEGGVDAVVSLSRVGREQRPDDVEHHELFLTDDGDPGKDPNVGFVLADTADGLALLHDEGKRVFLHCAAGASRTPTVAAAYLVRHRGLAPDEAIDRVGRVVPWSWANPTFRDALEDLPMASSA
ncbi:MAG: ADP-ribosylglycohydrolase family protein [Nitriliruptorales bacterium]|nr:ADP-ribosylglycohydrolase family protein [Nitriliruptorales bacterium]